MKKTRNEIMDEDYERAVEEVTDKYAALSCVPHFITRPYHQIRY